MTTKFVTIKFAKFPSFIVMEFPKKNSVLGQFSVIFHLPNPLQNANFVNIVVSASLIIGAFVQELGWSPRFRIVGHQALRQEKASKILTLSIKFAYFFGDLLFFKLEISCL